MSRRSSFLSSAVLCLFLLVAITACASDTSSPPSNNNNNNNNPPPADSVTTASTAVAATFGAQTLSSGSILTFNVAADIGDSWRFDLNTANNTFVIAIISSRLGLTNAGGGYTKTTSADGKIDTYVSTTPNATFDLAVDNRTKIITGVASLKSNAASVTGTGYTSAAGNFGLLAGDYVFGSFTYLTGGRSGSAGSESSWGTLRVSSAGVITMCTYGQINAFGNCDVVVSGLAPTRLANLTTSPYTGFRVQIRNGTNDFGIAIVQAGDRGAGIVIDRNGPDTSDPTKTRVGTIYAVVQKSLAGVEMTGKWDCSGDGTRGLEITVNGTVENGKDIGSGDTWRSTLQINKVKTGLNTTADMRGIVNSHHASEGPGDPVTNAHIIAMSSSMAVAGGDEIPTGRPLMCGKRAL